MGVAPQKGSWFMSSDYKEIFKIIWQIFQPHWRLTGDRSF